MIFQFVISENCFSLHNQKKPKEKSAKRSWNRTEQGRLHYAVTVGSQLKQRVPVNVDLIWDDLDESSEILDSAG